MWKVLVIGCNGITQKWLNSFKTRADIQIVGFADPIIERAQALKRIYARDAAVFSDHVQALEQCPANLVLDATPPHIHHSVVTAALQSGKHIIGEKPMSDSLDAAIDMVRVSDQTGKRYLVMQNRRFLSGIQTLRAQLDNQTLGTPYLVTCDMFLGAHFRPDNGTRDFRYSMQHPLLVDMLIHTFDQARYILGDCPVTSAYCQELNPPDSWYDHPAIALCTFEFDNGAVLSLRGSWATRSENTTSHGAWRVYCTQGSVCWDGADRVWKRVAQPVPPTGYIEEEGILEEVPLLMQGRSEHAGCVDAMLDALYKGTPMMTDCHNNIHSLQMVHACIQSAAQGQKVACSSILTR